MANNSKFVLMITSILLALTIFCGKFSALGRPIMMQSDENKEHVITNHENNINVNNEIASLDENVAPSRRHVIGSKNFGDGGDHQFGINDFRPTDPGHSPGAGHASPRFATAVDPTGEAPTP
ncbi:hypothetical protein PIB30_047711 [Stylosanthes scabra]|uniref:Uncharacterized protein n=1 Tax=Stylosanthes scabra TaxID=79078 RepID=A0ABU6TIQ6_9FABA|nr:hypothetical protein [Stylosanthes scabra]